MCPLAELEDARAFWQYLRRDSPEGLSFDSPWGWMDFQQLPWDCNPRNLWEVVQLVPSNIYEAFDPYLE